MDSTHMATDPRPGIVRAAGPRERCWLPDDSPRRPGGRRRGGGSDERRLAVGGDRGDLLRGALELVVGEHGGALEREITGELQPRAAAAVLVADLHRHRARDAIRAEEDHVKRMAPLPGEALLGV